MKKYIFVLLLALSMSITACGKTGTQTDQAGVEKEASGEQETAQGVPEDEKLNEPNEQADKQNLMEEMNQAPINIIDDKYRTFYEIFVYSFFDSNEDGVGDIKGLTQNINYINDGTEETDSELVCNGIWLMPIMPSTTYHKYDVIDYLAIDKEYGTMQDFEEFMQACKERDIHVILDLVMNHTSSKHAWFIEATEYLQSLGDQEPSAADCPYFEYYNFTKESGQKGYYQVAGTDWYYEGGFWSEMPDLNLKNQEVRKEFDNIVKFWLDKGVDGFRIDAAKEFIKDNTSENVEILSWLNDTVKGYKEDAYIVAEVWSNLETIAAYYESGIDSVFNFAFADNNGTIVKALRGDASSYGKGIAKLEEAFSKYNPNYIDAPFYVNHDLARGAGYFAGENGERQVKMAQALNLMMSGNAFLYYGEELGMRGSGKDENKRAPMQWSENQEEKGMCRGPIDMESFEMSYGSLEAQMKDPSSIYRFVKQCIKLRNQYPAIARGTTEYLAEESDAKVCILKKSYQEEEIFLLYNLSAEEVSLQLSDVIGDEDTQGKEIGGVLLTEEIAPSITEDGKIVLPAYSMTLLK